MKHGTAVGLSSIPPNRLRLDEPWHGNVLLSCGPHKLEPNQRLQEFNADFVPRLRYHKFRSRRITLQVCLPRLAGAGLQVRGVPEVSRFFAPVVRSNGLLGVRLRQQPASAE